MRQKMMIMGALLPDPAIWILDEPMTAWTPRPRGCSSSPCAVTRTRAKTVLFSTHVLDVAEKVVDRVGVIAHGELLFVGTVDEMREHFKSNGSLEEMFLELTSENSPFCRGGQVMARSAAQGFSWQQFRVMLRVIMRGEQHLDSTGMGLGDDDAPRKGFWGGLGSGVRKVRWASSSCCSRPCSS